MRPARRAIGFPTGRRTDNAGMVLVRQRPGSASGVTFVTVEDETGVANLVVWLPVFERHRQIVLSAGMLACHGRVQREGEVIHVVADRLEDLSDLLRDIQRRGGDVPSCLAPGSWPPNTAAGPSSRDASGVPAPELRAGGGIRVTTRDSR